MFDKKQSDISTDEIISGLRNGEKIYRGFKRGLEVAEAFKLMEIHKSKLEEDITKLENTKTNLQAQVDECQEMIAEARESAAAIVKAAEDKAHKVANEKQEEILVAQSRADDDLEDAAKSLAAVKDEVLEAERERDAINAEIRDLEEIKAKARKQLEQGIAS